MNKLLRAISILIFFSSILFNCSNLSITYAKDEPSRHIRVDNESINLSTRILHLNEPLYISFRLQSDAYVFDGPSSLLLQYTDGNDSHNLYFDIHYDPNTDTYYGLERFGGWIDASNQATVEVSSLFLYSNGLVDSYHLMHSKEYMPPSFSDYNSGYQDLSNFNFLYVLNPYPFLDISGGEWYQGAIDYVNYYSIMTGLTPTTFGPTDNLARAQFAVILHRMNGEPQISYTPKFHDIASGQWYTNAILWAESTGVVTGYSNGNFGPADMINREQMAVMMYRYALHKGLDTSINEDFSHYQDAYRVSDFAERAMGWAIGNDIITGKYNETLLDPQGNASRAECATIIMRFCEKYEITLQQ